MKSDSAITDERIVEYLLNPELAAGVLAEMPRPSGRVLTAARVGHSEAIDAEPAQQIGGLTWPDGKWQMAIASPGNVMKRPPINAFLSACFSFTLLSVTSLDSRAASDFVIEAEDFNYGSGQRLTQADAMPYYSGAYNGMSAVAGVDYQNNDGLDSDTTLRYAAENGDIDSDITFTAAAYAPLDIGAPDLSGYLTTTTNSGFDVVGAGSDIGGTTDQFQFAYQLRSGNFDVKTRVQSLDPVNAWAKAGLMARATLDANSAFASVLTTPSIPGSFLESRTATGANAAMTGWLPVNHPYTWLRLQRNANLFSGFGSFDGLNWRRLGSVHITMPWTVYFGLAVTSHDTSRPAAGKFRDLGEVSFGPLRLDALPTEPIGPCSRKTGLVISEIMYKPAPRADGRNLEFIELYNSNPYYEDISYYRISGDIDFTFPQGTILQGGAFLVVAAMPSDIAALYGITNVTGPYADSLKRSGVLRLRNDTDAIYLEVPYSNQNPWPVAADGTGHSLVLARPSYGEADPRAWAISDSVGGSPGGIDGYQPSPLRSVVINEFLAHTDPPLYDYIELYNHSSQPVDVSGCSLSDRPDTNRFVIPTPTVIAAQGFVYFDENALKFRLSALGETIYFKSPDGSRVLDAVQFEGQANGVSMGRVPDGAADFYPLQTRTPGTNNNAILVRDIVINEIMYKPISGDDNDQYVELYNKGTSPANAGGWRFTSGISYLIPANTVIDAGGYLVVAKNVTNLLAHYPNLNPNNTIGNFGGRLSGNGERLALSMPDLVINTNTPGATTTNTAWIVVDEVTYGTGGRWPKWANGGGSSLELIDPRSNHRLAGNWADSDETGRAPWTNIETTGALDNGRGYNGGPIDLVQVGLLGEGECLVDNIECRPGTTGANYVSNPDFQSGLTGWSFQGDHVRSSLESTGYQSTASLHLRASDSMWTGANSAQCPLTDTSLASGQTATLRLKARWLRGWPEVMMRVHGNWLETSGRMAIPADLGTPGARNTRAAANTGPDIYEVTHSPTLPSANEAVLVTALAHDPDGIRSLQLKYRVDPTATYTTATMVDDGTGGDAVAGDGIYSATIPANAPGTIAAFYIQATDNLSAVTQFPAALNDNGPNRECLVAFGDPIEPSGFGAYHLWLSQASIDRWSSQPDLSNEPIDGTFVCRNRVIYNMNSHYAGSPYHQQFDSPIGNPCHYNCSVPDDDQFLGTTSFNKIHAPGNGPFDDDTILREQTCYWMVRQLRLPWNYRRYIAMYVNGSRRGTLMEDSQVPNGDVVREQFPDDTDGSLYKLQPWFEFDDDGQGFSNNSWCTLNNYTTAGGIKKLARYRWNYLIRKVGDSANNYTNVFALINAANTYATSSYVPNMETLADMEEWMRIFAIEHAVGNWDAFGAQNAQNMYGYKPERGKWTLWIWDYNIVLGNSGSWGPGGNNLFTYNGADTPMGKIYANPTFRRAYLRCFKEIANGPMVNANVDPVMDARYAAFLADGLGVNPPDAVKEWIATMRDSLLSTLAAEGANAAFAITSNNGQDFATNRNQITLFGNAPVEVKTITVNGVPYPLTWKTVTGWTLKTALGGGANALIIQGYDIYGNPVPNTTRTITVTYTGTAELPQDRLAINEIMYNPAVPNASFVEFYNSSTVNAFDLSGWRLDGADFSFPGGSIIQPNGFLVVAGDAQGFAAAYGSAIPLAGVFNGKLSNGGETLKLVMPGATPDQDAIIKQVTYDNVAPWPAAANGYGPSLQLIDSTQDNNRVANWAVAATVVKTEPQWQYVSVTGTATSSRLYVYLSEPANGGDAYVDDIQLVAGSVPAVGQNYVQNGDFESDLSGPWNLTANTTNSSLATTFAHAGTNRFNRFCTTNGTTEIDSVWEDTLPLVNGNQYTLSYWYRQNTNGGTLIIRLASSGVRSDQNIAPPPPDTSGFYTPGASNSVQATMAPLPLVWLNEVQPDNATGISDHLGHRHPWVELYNSGADAINLNGYFLANSYTNLTQWAFPINAVIDPGRFKVVYLDGNPSESTGTEFHTSFAAPTVTGSLALSQTIGDQTRIVDYLNYKLMTVDRSYGAFPEGTPAKRQRFYFATPGATNNNVYPTVPVFINEWMANNTRTIADPVDGGYHDWFELYNSGPADVDLSRLILANSLTNTTQFPIPPGYVVPAGGHLLVWADNNSGHNNTNDPALHVNFKLSAAGETIALFTPGGSNVDAVTFGQQTNDVSQGRWPDGNSGQFYYMITPTPGGANVVGAVANHPPVLSPIANQSVNEGNPLMVTASATDPDSGQTLTYSLDPGAPPGAAVNSSSGVFSWVPTEAQGPGTYSVTVRVTDSGSPALSDTRTLMIAVNEVNSAPSLVVGPNQTIDELATLTVAAKATDPDIPAQTLTFSLDPGAPAGATIDAMSGVFTWMPTEAQGPGTYPVTIRVTDNGLPPLSIAETMVVTVNEVNAAPVQAPIDDQTATAGTQLTVKTTAKDTDIPANTLTFSLDPGAPAGAAIDPSSGVFTWTPPANQAPATNSITVRVTDDGSPRMSDAKTFTVVVLAAAQLRVTGVIVSDNAVTMNWNTLLGKVYRVEYKDDLNQTSWNSLGDFNGTGSTMSVTNSITGRQRYYRVQQMN